MTAKSEKTQLTALERKQKAAAALNRAREKYRNIEKVCARNLQKRLILLSGSTTDKLMTLDDEAFQAALYLAARAAENPDILKQAAALSAAAVAGGLISLIRLPPEKIEQVERLSL
ncbi:hypothetical protein MTBLM1_10316 [Rhodospirillaceae bacterium LM-1]|nr:hypothetical protein MTBLM1_10316 [Rhodospirillaceae bacterium LM-1]